ncbi:MAG: pyridoxamine 5'-phosphate oxidase [Crocinitomicaceae bacterium]|jgi:pyridoxamine 5'-phosphate oxidase|tara:strand:- start:37823 stop:38470 length:648 start_codon:yes stop_codon:yes gene_type:complete
MKEILDSFRLGHHEFNGGKDGFEFNGLDPFQLFELWMNEAVETKEVEPNAFVLSTVNTDAQPSSRIVYLKDIIDGQLVLYTNYSSKKGINIASNSNVSILFFWANSSRQIRIEGTCSQIDPSISDAYFASRPRGSQIGAWASIQSKELLDRSELEDRVKKYEIEFPNEVPRPEHWGGYGIEPTRFEFWQGRPSRLHDRIEFEKNSDAWSIRRLNP